MKSKENRMKKWRWSAPDYNINDELTEIEELFQQIYTTWYGNSFDTGFQVFDFSREKPDSMDRLRSALNELLDAIIEFKNDTNPANRKDESQENFMKRFWSQVEYIDEDDD